MTGPPDEFAWIDRLRRLTRGDPRALDLRDDAAVIQARPGRDLVVSVDAMVEGVHFLSGERPDRIAQRLLRTSLSDLAAKAARPFGYFLTTAWPADRPWAYRDAFISGLAEDGDAFGVALLGGDTVTTSGPLTLSATVLGWVEAGRAVPRSGARPGDAAVICGVIGDGWLGLKAARGELSDPGGRLASHYRTPRPLLALAEALRTHAVAAADVSDGLLADLGHVARASGCLAVVDLDQLPLSLSAAAWCADQEDEAAARLALASGGDDYALVCAVRPGAVGAFVDACAAKGVPAACAGQFLAAQDGEAAGLVQARFQGRDVRVSEAGWRH
jgi:thiamine-monophosphate kinase